jgi:hypothetical protein
MTITDRIEINPKVMLGKPLGIRITIELILRKQLVHANQAAADGVFLLRFLARARANLPGAVVKPVRTGHLGTR